jgi:ABC-type nitrate/sulfonate/bicarbonate transport system substrate-binding protein
LRIILSAIFFLMVSLLSTRGEGYVAPVGQLPSVTVSVTPSAYALPVLLVAERKEWEDFGIQINLKVYADGEEQIDRIVANEWEVGVMDPFYAVKGGNDGDIAIVGLAGNFASQFHLVIRPGTWSPSASLPPEEWKGKKILCPIPSAEHFWLKAFLQRAGADPGSLVFLNPEGEGGKTVSGGKEGDGAVLRSPRVLAQAGYRVLGDGQAIFMPACLVATSTYADTRKTLVVRWIEGYSRGVRLIQKDPSRAASRLRAFYRDRLKIEVPEPALEKELGRAFFFEEDKREGAFRGSGENPGSMETFARAMTDYQIGMKNIETKKDPADYILSAVCGQLSKLRKEAETQLQETHTAIARAEGEGAAVRNFREKWLEARQQLQEGRGCLAVIGVLSDLQREAEQTRMTTRRLRDFRKIELGIGAVLALYYAGYFVRRARNRRRESRLSRAGY